MGQTMRLRLRHICALSLLLIIGRAGGAQADTTVKTLAPGVTLTQEIDKTTPLVINVVSVDLDAPGVRIGIGIGQDRISGTDPSQGREDVSRLARRHGALAAINADFFPFTGDPLGVGIKDGELFSEPWTGLAGKGGPRAALGLRADGRGVLIDTLGFLGDLQVPDGQRTFINGIDRSVSRNEIIVFSALYGDRTANKPGGTDVMLEGVNLPVRANKLIVGRVRSVQAGIAASSPIPSDGLVLSGGPGTSADWLNAHLHVGEKVGFVLGIAPMGQTQSAIQAAMLPPMRGGLPSRAGAGISRRVWDWTEARAAVGGGPRLLAAGQVVLDSAAEGFDAGFVDGLHPRTAVGVTHDGRHLLLVTVDGRQAISKGISLPDLALILKRYGAWDAINLDGGGSTAMAVSGLTVSSPQSGGGERPVADMLLVYSEQPAQPVWRRLDAVSGDVEADQENGDAETSLRLLAPPNPVLVGSATPLAVQDGARLIGGGSPRLLWQGPTTGGIGFVNQKGYFIAVKPGTGLVSALWNGHFVSGRVTVIGLPPAMSVYTLRARLATDPGQNALQNQLVVQILDQNGKPLANAPLQVTVTGGASAQMSGQTNADGYAIFAVVWAQAAGGALTVRSGALTPVTIARP